MIDQHRNIFPEVPLNALEIYRMLPEGTRCEVVFNELIMSPSPSSFHQFLLSDLHALLYTFLQEKHTGKIIPAPFDVYFENYASVVQPDLMIVLNKNLHRIKKDGLYGMPDIIIEILSCDKAYDVKRKRALYEKAGVKEYFLIDPENKNTTLLTLNTSGAYLKTYEKTGVLNSEILVCDINF
jgi:Uma2 family endonuclease